MRRRTWLLLGAAVAVLLALAVAGWLWTAARTADDVRVAWRDGDPTCTGTTVRSSEEHGRVVQAVPGMRCTYRIEIHNDGDRGVHLDQVLAPFVGPTTGAVVTAEGAEPDAETGGRDAVFVLDEDLEPGGSTELDIVVVFHPEGCNDGGTLWVDAWPSVSVETLNRTYERAAAETFAFRHTGKTPGCRGF